MKSRHPNALLIPEEGPVLIFELDGTLAQLQTIVGGLIQALALPELICPNDDATAYVNEDGKFEPDCEPNMRATDFLVPGVGLFWGDHIAGPMVLCGFDPDTGLHAPLPPEVVERVWLIEE